MKLYLAGILYALLLITVLDAAPTQAALAQRDTELAGRTISMELVQAEDLSPAAWPTEEISLTSETVVTKAGDSAFNLLETNSIRPDAEAFTLLYDLNPSLERADPLPSGTRLVVPKVVGGTQLKEALRTGHIVMLTVDRSIKETFGCNTRAITALSVQFSNLDRSRFADPGKRDASVSSVQELALWFEHVRKTFARRTAKPLRQATLRQIHNEADVLKSILESALAPGQKLNAQDQAQISDIHEDIGQVMEKWDQTMAGELPPSEPQFNVAVEIKGGDAARVQTLRVYYVERGLFRNPPVNPPVRSTNFNGLGRTASALLPIKNYKIWAARDGEPSRPVTPVMDLKVRKPTTGNVINFELSLTP